MSETQATAPSVLVVEDEPDLAEAIRDSLTLDGYQATVVHRGAEALSWLDRNPVDLVVLDWMLPDLDGLALCRRIKAAQRTKVIMLTARGTTADRVAGLEAGADDYLVKPFSMRELALRIKAVLRRSAPPDDPDAPVEAGPVRVDPSRHEAWIGDDALQLTALEFRLLHALISRPNRVWRRDALLEEVWGISAEVTTRTVDTHIKRLRHKLGAHGGLIETLRGVGYRFAPPPSGDGPS